MAKYAKALTNNPTRSRFKQKDPRGFAEFVKHLSEHPDVGSANTMQEYQGKRPSLYDFEAEWKKLDLPTLIICGDEDEPCLQPSLYLKRVLPNAGLALFAKTGHTVNIEEPDAFNRELWNFLMLAEAGKWTPASRAEGAADLTGRMDCQAAHCIFGSRARLMSASVETRHGPDDYDLDRHGVIERAVAAAEAGRGLDGLADVGTGARDRVLEAHLLRQAGGDRRGERAAGAVGVRRLDARILEALDPAVVEQQVDDACRPRDGRPSSAPPWRRARPAARRRARMSASVRTGKPASTSASGRLGVSRAAIGSSVSRSAASASLSSRRWPPLATITGSTTSGTPGACFFRDGATDVDHLGAVQHAGLERIGADVGQHDLDLLGDEGGIDRHDAVHALGVLRGERGDGGGGEAAHRGDRLDVGLDARAAAGIRAGDDQDATLHAGLAAGSPR